MNEFDLFQSALNIEDPKSRKLFLQSQCEHKPELLLRVEALLASHENQSQFLATPVVEQMVDISDAKTAATILAGNGSTEDDEHDATAAINSDGPVPLTKLPDESGDEIPIGYLHPPSNPNSLGRLGHYEVLEVVGRGAFGTVLRAFDEKLQRVVAIKVLAPEMAATSPARKRFLREARTSAAIRHENVVGIHSVEEEPIPYLVMEYIPGRTLQQRLDEHGPLSVMEVLKLGKQIADGLAAAHAQDLIHRDIKPGNILLEGGVTERVKITDFGLARTADDASMTQSGLIAGTPMYMAPEQAMGHKLDQRADLFSLGSVLYQMLSGRPPFRAANTVAVLKRVVDDTPRPIQEIIPEVPTWMCEVVHRLHAKNPDERIQTAQEVSELLAQCLDDFKAGRTPKACGPESGTASTEIRPTSTNNRSEMPRVSKNPRTRWAPYLLIIACVIGLVVYGRTKYITPAKSDLQATADRQPTDQKSEGFASKERLDNWVQLFNGKDLTGWKTHPDQRGEWEVKDGIIVGSTVGSYLFSDASNFTDFNLRIQAKINRGGDSGVFFRSPFAMRPGRTADSLRPAGGYEVELHRNPAHQLPTGSVWNAETSGPPMILIKAADLSLIEVDDWFTLEIVARGNHFITKVNGTQTAECDDPENKFQSGCIALQVLHPQTIVQFRKIEIKELPSIVPSKDASTDAMASKPHQWPADAPPPAIAPFDAAQAKAHQEAWAKHLGVPVEYTNSIGMKFRLIPPGEFLMGIPPEEFEAELKTTGVDFWREMLQSVNPQHKVILTKPYYMGVNEVTQTQYEQIMGTNPSKFSAHGESKELVANLVTGDHPVESVSWNDAAEFCARLSQREKLKPSYFRSGETVTPLEGTGYRLPTEAEWENACRAGTTTRFWSGDEDDHLASVSWVGANSNLRTHPVGERKANPFGLADMHGNVWEWVQDDYDPAFYSQFKEKAAINPVSVSSKTGRAKRGGNHTSNPGVCRSSMRIATFASARSDGFRVAIPVDAITQHLSAAPAATFNSHQWPADAPPPAIAPFDAPKAKAHQEAWAKYLGVPVEYTNSIGMKFRLIPPSEFIMGSTVEEIEKLMQDEAGTWWRDKIRSESPQHKVILTKPLYVGVTEVTQREYEQVTGTNPSQFSATGRSKGMVANMETGEHPVDSVSWNAAAAFCWKLSQREEFKPFNFRADEKVIVPAETGYRLLSEAEWENACRAGTTTRFWSGNEERDLADVAWMLGNAGRRTHPVGERKPNPFGLYDMLGNEWEWVLDSWEPAFYGRFTERAAVDPWFKGTGHVLRGGSYGAHPRHNRSSTRHSAPDMQEAGSFRVVLPVDAVKQRLSAAPAATSKPQRWTADAPLPAIAPFHAAKAKAHQEAWAKYLSVPVEYTNSIGMKFHLIPPGEFLMGNTESEIEQAIGNADKKDEWFKSIASAAPQHKVILTRPIYLGITEVKQAEYQHVMGTNPSHFAVTGAGKEEIAGQETSNFPVEMVTWYDTIEFCTRLGQQEKLRPSYFRSGNSVTRTNGAGYRLPSEAEWEFACRAGTTTEFWSGNDRKDLMRTGWFKENSGGRPHAVGELPANPFGLFDVHGNVYEWLDESCDPTYYEKFREESAIDPISPGDTAAGRGVRGGNWNYVAPDCRSARRYGWATGFSGKGTGFRVVLAVDAVKQRLNAAPTATSTFTDADIARIAALPAEQQVAEIETELKKRNPKFNGKLNPTIEDGVLTGLAVGQGTQHSIEDLSPLRGMKLTRLDFTNYSQVRDLSPLRGMPLKELSVWPFQGSDLTPLDGMPLKKLTVGGGGQKLDLAPLTKLRLEFVGLNYSGVSDLSPLKDMPLTKLHCNNAEISSLSPLRGLFLEVLTISNCRVSDLTPLQGMSLQLLDIDGTRVTDLTPLQGMPLRTIRLTPKNITKGLDILREMKSLEKIGVQEGRIWPAAEFWERYDNGEFDNTFTDADVARITALAAEQQVEEVRKVLVKLNPGFDGRMEHKIAGGVVTEIEINSEQVTDIAPIRVFGALVSLNMAHTNVSDAKLPLIKGCSNLASLYLGDNKQITDEGLRHVKSWKKLSTLHLAGTQVTDEGMLHLLDCQNLRHLTLDRTRVSDVGMASLKGMPLKHLTIYDTSITDVTALKGMPLEAIRLTPKNITRGLDILRDMQSIKNIGITWRQVWPAAEFWERYDKGEFNK